MTALDETLKLLKEMDMDLELKAFEDGIFYEDVPNEEDCL